MKFTKMHGIGNDYIYISRFAERVDDPSALARRLSQRRFGVGSDGLILVGPSSLADFSMEVYNPDGSRAEMCGNGIRCLGKYVYDKGLTERTHLTVETPAGVRRLKLLVASERVTGVTVDMGAPEPRFVDRPVTVGGTVYQVTALSMGNPHAVLFVGESDFEMLPSLGPLMERHPLFPQRTNVELVSVDGPRSLTVRVWERGTGETLACGTGACAALAAAVLTDRADRRATVHLPGGDLELLWEARTNHMMMTGAAQTVYEGELPGDYL